ncbi:movement protein binding protein 2C [Wolffia australiana]
MLERTLIQHGFADLRNPTTDSDISRSSSPPIFPPNSSKSDPDPEKSDVLDKVLFKNLVEMVPLVESLMDKRSRSSFTRRASVAYTPAPSHDRKTAVTKNRKTAQSLPLANQRETGINNSGKCGSKDDGLQADDSSVRKPSEELLSLKEEVSVLQKKILEKEEILKSMESSVDQLRKQVEEKDSVIKTAVSQVSSLKLQLADKQAAVEKLEWEVKTSNERVENLQRELETVEYEASLFVRLLEELSKSDSQSPTDEYITYFPNLDNLVDIDVDEDGMEEARKCYVAAIAAAKDNPTEETLHAAAEARQRLQAFVLQ